MQKQYRLNNKSIKTNERHHITFNSWINGIQHMEKMAERTKDKDKNGTREELNEYRIFLSNKATFESLSYTRIKAKIEGNESEKEREIGS